MMKPALHLALAFALVSGLAGPAAGVPFHVTYLWHMHQPIYYPYESPQQTDAAGRFNFSVQGVWDSDRQGAYKTWPRDAVQAAANRSMAHAGAQMSYSGSLSENNNNLWGYCTSSDWDDGVDWARNGLRTSLNNPRLDVVGVPYHHSLMPLTCKESMRMQIRLHKELYGELWDTTEYSKGFWPPECAFDSTMIPALVEEGLEWVIVDNGHLFRTVPDFPWNSASSCRPNPADVRNPSSTALGSQWIQLQNIWAPTAVLAPWAYQPHYGRYVNPDSGEVQKIIMVPAGRYEGNENGRGGYGAFKPQNVWGAHAGVNNNGNKPMLILCHSDGDNYGMKNSDAWHGQHEQFLDMCLANADFDHTSVQDYLSLYPPDANDVVHVEPGSWVGIDGGTPYYEKWLSSENRSGEMPDLWSWSVLVAAQNRVLHADALENSYLNLGGGRTMDDVQWGINNDTARAWHWYLVSETSCYWYWDYDRANPWDGNATRACNQAVTEANKVIGRHSEDATGPSIFPPQRTPYNPGGKMWNEASNAAAEFDVWTFVDDVNALGAVRLYWRRDKDGQMPMSSTRNEIYAGGEDAEVGDWNIVSMTGDWWPTVKGPNVPDPLNRAMRYRGHINAPTNALLDYFVEAVDTRGNTNRSNIIHVYVGEGDGSGGGAVVAYSPDPPRRGENCTITYNSAGRVLSSANPVKIHLGFNNWAAVVNPDPAMTGSPGALWSHTFFVSNSFTQVDCVFNNGSGTWDNNGGADWHKATVEGGPVPSSATFNPASPNSCNPVLITYYPNDTGLTNAAQVYVHLLYNGGQGTSHAAMAKAGVIWSHTTQILPYGTTNLVCTFNDDASPSGGSWDNNGGTGWSATVTGCAEPPPPPYVTITNPASETITVGNEIVACRIGGTSGTGVVGHLQWANSLGGSGTVPAASSWGFDAALAVGTNVITVSGTNSPSTGKASDSASDAAYGSGWNDGSNGGTGFGAWQFYRTTNDSNKAGWFLANGAADCNIGSKAWGLYANSGQMSEAKRSLGSALAVGDTLSVKLDHGSVDAGGSVGLALQNAGGSNLWQCYYQGGQTNYLMTASNTGIAATTGGMDVEVTLTASNAFSARINPYGGTARTFAGNLEAQADPSIARFRVWNYKAGAGSGADLFLTDLAVTGSGAAMTTGDTVRIIREAAAGFVDQDNDQMDDNWESANGLIVGVDDSQDDGDNDHIVNEHEFVCDTSPQVSNSLFRTGVGVILQGSVIIEVLAGPPTTNSRVYEVLGTSDLMPPVTWSSFGVSKPGRADGGALSLVVTNYGDHHFFRTAVRRP